MRTRLAKKVESYRHWGLISIGLFWLVTFLMVRLWSSQGGGALSYLAAVNATSYVLFAITLTMVVGIFYMFMREWFIPRFGLGQLFTAVLNTAVFTSIFVAWVPAAAGLPELIHKVFVYALGSCVVAMAIGIAAVHDVSALVQRFNKFIAFLMVVVALLWLIPVPSTKQPMLYQVVNITAFHVMLIVTTYWQPRTKQAQDA